MSCLSPIANFIFIMIQSFVSFVNRGTWRYERHRLSTNGRILAKTAIEMKSLWLIEPSDIRLSSFGARVICEAASLIFLEMETCIAYQDAVLETPF